MSEHRLHQPAHFKARPASGAKNGSEFVRLHSEQKLQEEKDPTLTHKSAACNDVPVKPKTIMAEKRHTLRCSR